MPFPFTLFRRPLRSTLLRKLAVAETRLELSERECSDLRERLATTTREYARFRDQVFARSGAIVSPVAESSAPSQAPPLASVFRALAVTSIRDNREGFPEPAMSET